MERRIEDLEDKLNHS